MQKEDVGVATRKRTVCGPIFRSSNYTMNSIRTRNLLAKYRDIYVGGNSCVKGIDAFLWSSLCGRPGIRD